MHSSDWLMLVQRGSAAAPAVALAQAPVALPSTTAYSGNLTNPTTAGSNLYLAVTAFSGSNVAISSSAPLLGGSAVPGAVKILEQQSAYDGNTTYVAVWKLPAVPGGQSSVSITVTNGTLSSQAGIFAYEVKNSTGTLDTQVPTTGASTAITAGPAGPTAHAQEFVMYVLANESGLSGGAPGAPWTSQVLGVVSASGYQLPGVTGTFTANATQVTANEWAAGLVCLQ